MSVAMLHKMGVGLDASKCKFVFSIFIRKRLCISVKIRINLYSWRHCSPAAGWLNSGWSLGVAKTTTVGEHLQMVLMSL